MRVKKALVILNLCNKEKQKTSYFFSNLINIGDGFTPLFD